MSTRTLIVPYALGEAEPRVLMARVQMLQTRVRSKEIRGQVPSHAGQWVLMGGKAPDGMAADDAAYQLFRERTGLNLADPELLARFGFAAPRIEKLQDANYTPFTALFLETNMAGLDGFTAEIRNNINNNPETLVDGIYAEVDALRQSQSLARIGPIPPPQDGWSNFILRNYYRTQGPGAMDTVYPTLVSQIAKRSRASGDLFGIALKKLPGAQPRPPYPPTPVPPLPPLPPIVSPRLVRFEVEHAEKVEGSHRHEYAADYQPGGHVVLHAVVEPEAAARDLVWSGAHSQPADRPNRRHVPLNAITPVDHPHVFVVTLGGESMEIRLTIEPVLEKIYFDGPVFPLGGGDFYTYAIGGHFGLPRDEFIEAVALTNPDTPEAWAHLGWGETDGGVHVAKRRKVVLDAPRKVEVRAHVRKRPQRREQRIRLDVRPVPPPPLNGLQLRVNQIVFGGAGNHLVARDEPNFAGVLFNTTWNFGTAHAMQPPLAYTRNTSFDINNATIAVLAPPPMAVPALNIRATAFVPRHLNPPVVTQWTWPAIGPFMAGVLPAPQLLGAQAPNALLPNEVTYSDPQLLFWEANTGAGWMLFDITTHMLYATLGNPVGYVLGPPAVVPAAPLFFTPLAVSCQRGHGTNNANALVAQMFGAFTALNAATGANPHFLRKRVPGNPPLTYWNPRPNSAQSLFNMLNNAGGALTPLHSGSCLAWAEMFIAMGAMHGIATLNFLETRADPGVVGLGFAPWIAPNFLVRNWTFNGGVPQAAAITHLLSSLGPAAPGNVTPNTVVPAMPQGLPGQNNGAPPPDFLNHFIVRYTPTNQIYDPSYGSGPHPNRAAWVTAASDGVWMGCLYQPPGLVPPPPVIAAAAGWSRAVGATPNRMYIYDHVTQALLP